MARFDGTNIRMRVNKGDVVTTSAGSVTSLAGTLHLCRASPAFNGLYAEGGIINTAESDDRFDDICNYVENYWDLTLN